LVEKEAISALQVGDQLLGKFAVERVLGQGGMGVVVQASHMVLGHKVAIKLLLPEACDHPASVSRFLREARAAVQIQSEHVARVSDVGTLASGLPYIIMEYLQGCDLAEELRARGVLPVEEATRYLMQALEAIAEAHSLNIVHRDLKPANVFLARRKDGTTVVKVLEFGISKALEVNEVNLTQTSSMMGSPLYMAPEQIRNAKTVDTRADVWSLGIILHECLCGRPPFFATTLSGVLAAIVADPPQELVNLRPDLPLPLMQAVARCLEKDPASRVQNVHELAQLIAPFCPEQAQRSLPRIAALVGKTLPQGTDFGVALTWSPEAMLSRASAATVPGYLAPSVSSNSMTAQTWSVPGPRPRKPALVRRTLGACALVLALISGVWWVTGGGFKAHRATELEFSRGSSGAPRTEIRSIVPAATPPAGIASSPSTASPSRLEEASGPQSTQMLAPTEAVTTPSTVARPDTPMKRSARAPGAPSARTPHPVSSASQHKLSASQGEVASSSTAAPLVVPSSGDSKAAAPPIQHAANPLDGRR